MFVTSGVVEKCGLPLEQVIKRLLLTNKLAYPVQNFNNVGVHSWITSKATSYGKCVREFHTNINVLGNRMYFIYLITLWGLAKFLQSGGYLALCYVVLDKNKNQCEFPTSS